MRLIRVAVPVPALEALTYRVPDELGDPGDRRARPRAARQRGRSRGWSIETGSRTPDPDPSQPSEAPGSRQRQERPGRPRRSAVPPRGRRRAGVLGGRVLRVRRGRSDRGRDAAARVGRERALRADHRGRGGAGCSTERGVRREILEVLTAAKPVRVDALLGNRRGAHAALLGLERDGLVDDHAPAEGHRGRVPDRPGRDAHRAGARCG